LKIRQVADRVRDHRWLVAPMCVVVFGYSYGKDMALRDNARDIAMVQETE
jgi:hypothetical protein